MILRSIFINIYIYIIDLLINSINKIKLLLFKIKKMRALLDNNTKVNLYWIYILYQIIKFFNKIPYIGNLIFDKIKNNYFCNKYKIVKIVIYSGNMARNIIYEDCTIAEIYNNINNFNNDINDLIMHRKYIITDIVLKTKNNSISLKKIFDKYSDRSKKFNHNIKNLLIYKNIIHDDKEDILEIKYINRFRYKMLKFVLNDIYELHISDICNFSDEMT